MIIRFIQLFDEAVRLQNQVRTLLKSIEIGDSKQLDIDKLQAENERLKDLVSAYENDLVLLNVSEKLEKAKKRIEELKQERANILAVLSEVIDEETYLQDPFEDDSGLEILRRANILLNNVSLSKPQEEE